VDEPRPPFLQSISYYTKLTPAHAAWNYALPSTSKKKNHTCNSPSKLFSPAVSLNSAPISFGARFTFAIKLYPLTNTWPVNETSWAIVAAVPTASIFCFVPGPILFRDVASDWIGGAVVLGRGENVVPRMRCISRVAANHKNDPIRLFSFRVVYLIKRRGPTST
jgi:hypothetical protein